MSSKEMKGIKDTTLMVAMDFSSCSRRALRKARDLLLGKRGRVIALHVIDRGFVEECARRNIIDESRIKNQLFVEAKEKLKSILREEGLDDGNVKVIVCEGTPYLEINRKASECNVDMIVMGSCGMVGDTGAIFFGDTTEKVMRFLSRPVLCIPPSADQRNKGDAAPHAYSQTA